MSVRTFVAKCHRKQTVAPRSANFVKRMHGDKVSSSVDFHRHRRRSRPSFSRSEIRIEYFTRDYLANGDRQNEDYYRQLIECRMWGLSVDIHIWPSPILKVKVMHSSPENISQTVKDRANIAIVIEREIASDLTICIFIFDCGRFLGQGWGRALKFDIRGTRYYCHQIGSHPWVFDWHIYIWPWPNIKAKIKVMHISNANISETLK